MSGMMDEQGADADLGLQRQWHAEDGRTRLLRVPMGRT